MIAGTVSRPKAFGRVSILDWIKRSVLSNGRPVRIDGCDAYQRGSGGMNHRDPFRRQVCSEAAIVRHSHELRSGLESMHVVVEDTDSTHQWTNVVVSY